MAQAKWSACHSGVWPADYHTIGVVDHSASASEHLCRHDAESRKLPGHGTEPSICTPRASLRGLQQVQRSLALAVQCLCSPDSPGLPLGAPFPETPLMRRKRRNGATAQRRNGAAGALPAPKATQRPFSRPSPSSARPPSRPDRSSGDGPRQRGLRNAPDYDLERRTLADSGRHGCSAGGISPGRIS